VARNYVTALQEAGRSANVIRQTKVVLGAMFTMAVSEGYLDYNPFHDLKIPRVPGRRAIKVTTTEQFLKVRGCLPTRAAQVLAVRMLTNHQTDSSTPFATILVGQPTLRHNIKLGVLAALDQRITVRYQMKGMTSLALGPSL